MRLLYAMAVGSLVLALITGGALVRSFFASDYFDVRRVVYHDTSAYPVQWDLQTGRGGLDFFGMFSNCQRV
jgi:hypothetical protein